MKDNNNTSTRNLEGTKYPLSRQITRKIAKDNHSEDHLDTLDIEQIHDFRNFEFIREPSPPPTAPLPPLPPWTHCRFLKYRGTHKEKKTPDKIKKKKRNKTLLERVATIHEPGVALTMVTRNLEQPPSPETFTKEIGLNETVNKALEIPENIPELQEKTTYTVPKSHLIVKRDHLINILSKDDLDNTYNFYKDRYSIKESPCSTLGEKNGNIIKISSNGYIRINAQVEKKKLKEKGYIRTSILWHHLCWRRNNMYQKIPDSFVIHQKCGNHTCGDINHLHAAHESVHSSYERCFYIKDVVSDITLLYCNHTPECIPPPTALPGKKVIEITPIIICAQESEE
ncbi:MAG: hypothetical protein P4L35_18380 [Ignavibacteriaceae bacterium]|nr:hypothetical protein [Ignavibacteriaceae bacterium]